MVFLFVHAVFQHTFLHNLWVSTFWEKFTWRMNLSLDPYHAFPTWILKNLCQITLLPGCLWGSISPNSCQHCVVVTRAPHKYFLSPPSRHNVKSYFPISLILEVIVWLALVSRMQVELTCVTSRWKLDRQCESHCSFPPAPATRDIPVGGYIWVSERGNVEQGSKPTLTGYFAWMRYKLLFLKGTKT